MHTYVYACIYVCIYIRIHICIHAYAGTCLTCRYFRIYECICVYMYIMTGARVQGGEDPQDALSLQVIFRKRAL